VSNPTILLVEDAPADILLTQRALKKSNIKAKLLVATDGAEAQRLLDGNTEISLVLLDLHLPKVDGLHILEQVRATETHRSLRIVIVTSSELISDHSQAMQFGADAYVPKPIDPTKLTKMIEELGIDVLKPSLGTQDG
jgi:two-component system response regulator